MTEDLVCGSEMEPAPDAIKSAFGGMTFYFCDAACKRAFDKDPARYIEDIAA